MPSLEDFERGDETDLSEAGIVALLRRGNLPLAEIRLRERAAHNPDNPRTLFLLGWLAESLHLPYFAARYYRDAAKLAPDWQTPARHLGQLSGQLAATSADTAPAALPSQTGDNPGYLLIKAWGHGFWSDVSHVLGQLLVAEVTGRIPLIHWGANSRFGDGSDVNAFDSYFERLSEVSVADLQREDFDFWPPKWTRRNLAQGEINKMTGPHSRISAQYLLGRRERVVVSDYYTGVVELRPWIPEDHALHGLSVDELYRHLVRRYLKPKKAILDEVQRFCATRLGTSNFVAVHARGSDKVQEIANLDVLNRHYRGIVDRYLGALRCGRIFLMTDDLRVLGEFADLYGDRIITTECQRTNTDVGVHYHSGVDRTRLGTEIMVDTYVAARAAAFVGNAFSNPSLMVQYLKDWPSGAIQLLGQSMLHSPNAFLHNW